ncbi:MAG: UvrB/UvrC motif-containing protein [Planctomycetes bacterium]|nr:UvrB/UvrC motif-containing protein [Planctomycetota bacterium]
MLCESCGKQSATHKSTDIVNNVKSVKYLCTPCFKRDGKDTPFSKMNLSSVLSINLQPKLEIKFSPPTPRGEVTEERTTCDECGMTDLLLRKKGAIGCPHCYEIFEDEIADLLLRLHGARSHRGRFPKDFQKRRAREHQATQLDQELSLAVKDERFEEAARLRDRIRALRRDEEDPTPPGGSPGDDG